MYRHLPITYLRNFRNLFTINISLRSGSHLHQLNVPSLIIRHISGIHFAGEQLEHFDGGLEQQVNEKQIPESVEGLFLFASGIAERTGSTILRISILSDCKKTR